MAPELDKNVTEHCSERNLDGGELYPEDYYPRTPLLNRNAPHNTHESLHLKDFHENYYTLNGAVVDPDTEYKKYSCENFVVEFRTGEFPTFESDKRRRDSTNNTSSMTSAWRVMSFFFVVFVVPTILIAVPLYARYQLYYKRTFFFTDGDTMSLHHTVSSFWCQSQSLASNGTFDAFLTSHKRRKEDFRVSKLSTNVVLHHDESEKWGFHLLEGSIVKFSTCSRWPGGTLIVVKGKDNMKKCFYQEFRTLEELTHPTHAGTPAANLPNPTTKLSKPVTVTQTDLELENHGGEIFSEDTEEFEPLILPQNVDVSPLKKRTKRDAKNENRVNDGLQQTNTDLEPSTTVSIVPLGRTKSINDHKRHSNYSFSMVDSFLSSFNDTIEVTAGNSSYSSSEEFMSHCISTIFTIDLSPYPDCVERLDSEQHKEDRWKFRVNETDIYFFLFSSDNSIETNSIDIQLSLYRTLYDVEDSLVQCSNATSECTFPLKFMTDRGAIVDFKGNYSTIGQFKDLSTYKLTSYCQPRSIVYTVLILLVPFVIVLFAFR